PETVLRRKAALTGGKRSAGRGRSRVLRRAGDRGGFCVQSPLADTGFDPGCAGCGGCKGAGAAMIPVPSGVRVWLAVGRTDMRKGMNGLALRVQQVLRRDPHAGDLYVFRVSLRRRPACDGGLCRVGSQASVQATVLAPVLEAVRWRELR